ncbi:MAG TPA: STAS/SEC14 domain-containing protein [Terriglobales bacterium]|nr:STAS/SEC14 domain-containing protein [Terriglobales bacterium]
MERIRFIVYGGKRILEVDVSRCSAKETEKLMRELPDHVTAEPRESVRMLVDFTGASFDAEGLRTMKETAIFNKPHIKRTAWLGAESLPESHLEEMSSYARRVFPVFKERGAALEWLAEG